MYQSWDLVPGLSNPTELQHNIGKYNIIKHCTTTYRQIREASTDRWIKPDLNSQNPSSAGKDLELDSAALRMGKWTRFWGGEKPCAKKGEARACLREKYDLKYPWIRPPKHCYESTERRAGPRWQCASPHESIVATIHRGKFGGGKISLVVQKASQQND